MNSTFFRRTLCVLLFLVASTVGTATIGVAGASSDPFPIPDAIVPNVNFWTRVYSEYGSDQGIVHDSLHMGIVYEIIELIPYDVPGASRVNRKRMKLATEKYRHILKRLAHNPRSAEKACRRVAALFDTPADAGQFRSAAGRVRCQIGQKDRFQAGLMRSGAYIDRIREIFASHGLPDDLAYLPHVESSFNINAYSKYGAAGMWQFTRSTGKRFMEVGYVLDERRDPILATHAAAQLLKENYDKLESWPLAITAYNHGAAGMQRAKALHGDFETVFKSYRSRSFKFASRNFYAEFLAARQVASTYERYFGALDLDTPAPTRVLNLQGYAALEDLCRHFKVSPEVLKQLNPALRQPVLSGQKHVPKGYALRLPPIDSDDSASMAAIPDHLFQTEQKRSLFYTVQRGDTAGKIARLHRVRLDDLILANNLNHRATIYPHQTLRIPAPGDRRPATTAPAIATRETVLAVRTPVPPAPAPEPVANATSPTATAEPNHYPQPLLASVIPLTSADPEPDAEPNTADLDRQARNVEIVTADVAFERIIQYKGQRVGIIQVEVEETLGHYAEWAKVSTRRVRRLNGLPYGHVLQLHQKIRIPLGRTSAESFEQNRYEYHKRLQEDFYAVYRIGELQSYRVQRGDSIWTLCRAKFDLPMWLLKHCNPEVDLAALKFHQKLIIPTIERVSTADAAPENEAEPDIDESVEDCEADPPDQV
jgi:membrane-bound lytic murein transglycosylase D